MAFLAVCQCIILCSLALVAAEDRTVSPDFREAKSCKECELKIPLEMALRLNMITDEDQLFREFLNYPEPEEGVMETPVFKVNTSGRFRGAGRYAIERKALIKPKPDGCIPEPRSMSLRRSEDPWIYYWPSCTRVEQCGGCCQERLSCQPLEVEIINFQVVVTEYVGNQLLYKGKEIVEVQKHTKCKCDCITKEKDCNALQEYRKGECRCLCLNKDAEAMCRQASKTKHWNPDNCSCQCLKVEDCSVGTYFSQETCSCEVFPDESQSTIRYNFTSSARPTLQRRRWPPTYSLGRGK